ncbi:hypothetical protein [Shimia haliotis]|uniref:Uncharacterized protein n=1 Tax=Shimia haliotis TaxID=1280847 RepID=A0A1I4CKN3_9RHOB|nr:hypothetical protein [Shimia haliotis]SFK81842.1 hypothetical protein SAMN04488036_102343 [Shimia haliotis]
MASTEPVSNKTLIAIYAVLLLAVLLWGGAIAIFGIPGLYIPALCAVPVIYTLLIIISRG